MDFNLSINLLSFNRSNFRNTKKLCHAHNKSKKVKNINFGLFMDIIAICSQQVEQVYSKFRI